MPDQDPRPPICEHAEAQLRWLLAEANWRIANQAAVIERQRRALDGLKGVL